MATATRKNPTPETAGDRKPDGRAEGPRPLWLRLCDSAFRFLASLKLAVICLAALSATLAYATKFNTDYGQNAANDYIYQSKGFALLLAFLAANIFCAAAIRFPWTKRQTGFVITHIGLLIVIAGSWWSGRGGEEGLLGMREGDTSSQLVLNHRPTIFVRSIDPHTGKPTGTHVIPFKPGAFDWQAGRYQVVSEPKDPFKLAVTGFYAASMPATIHVAEPGGLPMLKLRPRIIPPGQKVVMDVFPSVADRWFVPRSARMLRDFKKVGPAEFIFTQTERPEVFDDFLNPPGDPGKEGVARLLYRDAAGKPRSFEIRLDGAEPGKPIPLPESDLVASFFKVDHVEEAQYRSVFGEDSLNVVQFKVRKGDGPELVHSGYAGLPMIPAIIPPGDRPDAEAPKPLVALSYFYPPVVDPQVNGRFGLVEVMADESGRLAYRVFERGTPAKVRAHGELKKGQEVTAFGGSSVAPMTLSFAVEDYLPSGREEPIAVPIEIPAGKMDEAIGAIHAELTVDGVTKDVWLRKSPGFEPDYSRLAFPGGVYEVAFDVDRLDLGFSLTLDDFDVGFDPGTSEAATYRSEVRLTDEAAGIKGEPRSIYMNHTLDHKGWRFFQTRYDRVRNPKTGEPTGEFVSIFQVAKNPAREVIYLGCIVVVLGAFVQFYMRAGIFTDGGKRDQARAAAQARLRLEAKAGRLPAPAPDIADADEPL